MYVGAAAWSIQSLVCWGYTFRCYLPLHCLLLSAFAMHICLPSMNVRTCVRLLVCMYVCMYASESGNCTSPGGGGGGAIGPDGTDQ